MEYFYILNIGFAFFNFWIMMTACTFGSVGYFLNALASTLNGVIAINHFL